MTTRNFSNVGSGDIIAAAEIDELEIRASGGVLYPRLVIPTSLILRGVAGQQPVDYVFTDLLAELRTGTREEIATAKPVKIQDVRRSHWPPQEIRRREELEFPLDTPQIAHLEGMRDGKDLPLWVNLTLVVQEHSSIDGDPAKGRPTLWGLQWILNLSAQMSFTIPRDTWIEKVLPNLGFGTVRLMEFPVAAIESCRALDHAFQALIQAQQQHRVGEYDGAVGKCRVALEKFFERIDETDDDGKTRRVPRLKKKLEGQIGAATYQWLNSMLRAIKESSDPTHHTPNPHFCQADSQMVIFLTAAVVSYAARTCDPKDII